MAHLTALHVVSYLICLSSLGTCRESWEEAEKQFNRQHSMLTCTCTEVWQAFLFQPTLSLHLADSAHKVLCTNNLSSSATCMQGLTILLLVQNQSMCFLGGIHDQIVPSLSICLFQGPITMSDLLWYLELLKLAKFKDKKATGPSLQIHISVIYFLTLGDCPVAEKHKTFPCPTGSLLAQRKVFVKPPSYLAQCYLCFWHALTFFTKASLRDGLKAKPRGWPRQEQTSGTIHQVASALPFQGKFVLNHLTSG